MATNRCPRHKDGKHKWTVSMHLDGCHFYSWAYTCTCGTSASTTAERDPVADPYSLIWMDEEGGSEPCKRCAEIRMGAKVKTTLTIIAKDGTVEKNETTEREQGATVA